MTPPYFKIAKTRLIKPKLLAYDAHLAYWQTITRTSKLELHS